MNPWPTRPVETRALRSQAPPGPGLKYPATMDCRKRWPSRNPRSLSHAQGAGATPDLSSSRVKDHATQDRKRYDHAHRHTLPEPEDHGRSDLIAATTTTTT